MNYKVTRIGLINFWLYDEETFDFEDGKLLLRGTNGSGKSVTMQSFIPLILDGNKNPSRLDPFGSKDKKIEDYLLGSADSEQKDEATGYLFMEMYSEEKLKYQTLGIGLHAKKGRPTDFWGFIIKNGQRIGRDILLYHSKEEKIPCSKKELRARLGTENIFTETAKEYKEAVNKTIFGFPNLDMYDEFINLLLQLRSPKLSKEYKPTKLMEILSGVLQPLTEEDLRPLSEAIEDMDKTKEKTLKLQSDVKKISNLIIPYNNYNETMLYKKAENYLNSLNVETAHEKEIHQLEEDIENLQNSLQENKKTSLDLEIRKENIETQRANLDSRDLESKIKRKESLESEIKEEQNKKEKAQNSYNNHITKRQDLEIDLDKLIKDKDKKELECQSTFQDIANLCTNIKFEEGKIILKDYAKDRNILKQFEPLKNRLKNYQLKLENIKKELEKNKRLEEKRNEIEQELNTKNKEYNKVSDNIKNNEEKLGEEILNIKDKVAYLGKTNEIIKLKIDEISDITSPYNPYSKTSYDASKQKYLKISSKIKDNLLKELYTIKNKIALQRQKVEDINKELNNLKLSKELEIIRDEEENKTIEYLNDKNIPYAEFYKAIEFKDNIDQNTKDKLESTLLSSGILNAIIVNDLNQIKNIKGNFITYSKPASNNLTKYFKPVKTNNLTEDIIINVLKSVSIDDTEEIALTKDYFKNSFMRIQGSQNFKSIYIGILSRIKAKEEKISQIEKELEKEESILTNLENIKLTKENDLTTLSHEENNYPSNEVLNQIESEIDKLTVHLEIISKDKNQAEEKLQTITEEIETLFKRLVEMKKEINFPLYLETIEEVLKNTQSLSSELATFEISLNNYYGCQENVLVKKEQIEYENNTIDEINENISSINISLKKKEYEKNDLDKILNSNEYKNLSETILKLDSELKQIDDRRINLTQKYGQDEEALKNKQATLEEKKQNQKVKHEIANLNEMFFKEEYNLHYIEKEPIENVKLAAKNVLEKFSNRKNSDIDKVKYNYDDAYNNYRNELSDYHLTSNIIFDREIEPNDIIDNETLKDLHSKNKRVDLSAMYQGRVLNIYSLSKTIENAIEENNQIISEQDRHLFEEILLKSVGAKIRERIESSKNWVKEINQIMKQMQEGSSLSFGLEWKSKSAESMDEIETKELVRIFQIDPNMVTKSDSDKLINHFRSKLKRETEMNGESETYSSVIFDVLDYRNWFEFKMTYQRKGENKKELTNKVFSVFSGGEKAKTMYIPLFAAVYAKLMSAKKDAPRLIALDEAFAGVDDANIREMFGILSSLNLDYILTSQALWGDYDTISNLAIAELLRPNNAQAVCVKRYRWNGKVKEIVLKKELNDAIPLF